MSSKQRLSASVDASLVDAAEQAVKRGRAKNLSAWVNDALRLKLEHDERLAALAAFVAEYEASHGVITDTDMRSAARRARSGSLAPEPKPKSSRRTGR
jgi:Arc/MetJ-type ribon-helix-helix transcriptional regulator